MDFFERLFDKKNYNLHKEVNGTLLLVSKETDCTSYESELRKEAYRLCREEGSRIKAALVHHRKHGTSYDPLASAHFDLKLSSWRRRLCSTRAKSKRFTKRSKGDISVAAAERMKQKAKAPPAPSQHLALANTLQQRNLLRGKDRVKKHNQKKERSKVSGSSSSKDFNALVNAGKEIRKNLSQTKILVATSSSGIRAPMTNVAAATLALAEEKTSHTTSVYASPVSCTDRRHKLLTLLCSKRHRIHPSCLPSVKPCLDSYRVLIVATCSGHNAVFFSRWCMWTPYISPIFLCPSIFWTFIKAGPFDLVCLHQQGPDFVIPTQLVNHLFELALVRLVSNT